MTQHDTLTPEQLDQHLDAILKAAGSALRHYTMQKSRDDMRAALRAALSATQPAQVAQSETCPTCGESEPYSGACGTSASDTRALCKRKAQAAQGAGEVVAIHPSWLDYWSFKECDRLARIWTEGIDLTKSDDHEDDLGPHWKVVMAIMLARLTHPTPAQPAPVVPEGWKLVPMKCDEAMKDVGIQFEFATVSDGRLLAQTMWNELLAATPTPPAQAAQQGEKA